MTLGHHKVQQLGLGTGVLQDALHKVRLGELARVNVHTQGQVGQRGLTRSAGQGIAGGLHYPVSLGRNGTRVLGQGNKLHSNPSPPGESRCRWGPPAFAAVG